MKMSFRVKRFFLVLPQVDTDNITVVVCILGEFVKYKYIFVATEFLQEATVTGTTRHNCKLNATARTVTYIWVYSKHNQSSSTFC